MAVSPSLVPPLYHEGQQLEGGTRLMTKQCHQSSSSSVSSVMMSVEGHMTNLTWKLHFIILSPCLNNLGGL